MREKILSAQHEMKASGVMFKSFQEWSINVFNAELKNELVVVNLTFDVVSCYTKFLFGHSCFSLEVYRKSERFASSRSISIIIG